MTQQTFQGTAGIGFEWLLPPIGDRPNPDTAACIGRWNLTLPGQHPLWNCYTLCLCHLRNLPGISLAKMESPDKTHEMVVFAVDPPFLESDFQAGARELLDPLNHVVQFTASNDEKAREVAAAMAQRLVNGQESAEPSGISGARERFRDSVNRLANTEDDPHFNKM